MNEIRPEQVINGSYGECWINDEYVAEIKKFEAKIAIEYEDIERPRKLGKAKKMIGYGGTGSIVIHKVTSRFARILSENLKNGKQTTVTIISKLDDPDAIGAERVAVKNATFNDLTLANWEAKKAGEEETGFNFDDWEFLDMIGDQKQSLLLLRRINI